MSLKTICIISLIGSIICSATAQILIKYFTININAVAFSFAILLKKESLFLYSALFCYLIAMVTWIIAMIEIPLSVGYPMLAVGYIIVFLFAKFVFKEEIGILQIIGFTFILIGVSFLGIKLGLGSK